MTSPLTSYTITVKGGDFLPKLQKHGGGTEVKLPAEIVKLLGWKAGNIVLADADKEKDVITLRRVSK